MERITIDATRDGWLAQLIEHARDQWPQAYFTIEYPGYPQVPPSLKDPRGRHVIYESPDSFFGGQPPVMVAEYA